MKGLYLLITGLILLAVFLLPTGGSVSASEDLTRTPPDYEGPFYPVTKQLDEDNDLVQVEGRNGTARGEILNLSGVILDSTGRPQGGVTIEIWQTDPEGRYLHPGDSTPGDRDPNFQYWGRDTTDSDGRFTFRTIVPGAYYPRPAHIHYKLWRNGKNILTSQIYFRKFTDIERAPSMTGRIDSQTVELNKTDKGELQAYYRIVL